MEPSDHPPGGERKSATDSPHVTTAGGRQRFTVELKPDETTIVSWKKLMKNAVGKLECPAPDPKPVLNPHVALESRLAPGQPANNEATDAPHRFSTLIEKIERLYMGKHSSDEEDLNDVPDDDEYDTEDSFIDDAELDEYFQVDNSAIKHDGFFVNRGTLERIDQPPLLPNQQPKKRRRKDMEHVPGEGNDDRLHSKNVKRGKKAVVKAVLSIEKNSVGPSEVMAPTCAQLEDGRPYKQTSSSAMCARDQPSDQKTSLDPSPSRISNGDHSLPVQVGNDAQKIGLISSKNKGGRFQDGVGLSDGSFQRSHGKNSYEKGHSQNTILSKSADESDQSVHRKEKHGIHRKPDLNSFDGKTSLKTVKSPLVQRKDGSSARPKSTALEKAIRELEKMVAESRPQSAEVQDGDISAQAVKRRLPHEVKQKLAKVARLAQASQGKISNELVNRLMSILGHLMQLRTLKRNLKAMIDMGLSAKKEKDDRFLQMKKEITELIRVRAPYIKSKALEHLPGTSGDIKEISPEDKELIKKRYCTDDALEEKLCDLYDLYLEGLDEDAGPRVRKLYAELAELWPDGLMDNHGVKRAICRAKDRKRSLHSQRKDQDKIKRQKLISRTEAVPVETAQSQSNMQENSVTVSSNHSLSSLSKPVATSTNAVSTSNNTVSSSPNSDWPKQEKVKGNSSNSGETRPTDALRKKKVKRDQELESSKAHYRPEKLPSSAQGEEKQRTQPQVVVAPHLKPSLPVAPPSSTGQTNLHDISQ